MTDFLPWVFRSCNAHIITTRYEWVRKPLKVLFLVSTYFRSWSLKKLNGRSSWTVIDNFDGSIKLKVDRSRTMGASFYWTGFHEVREFIFLHHFLKDNMVVVDIGANLGEYTLFISKRTGRGQVFAFEPMQLIREQLVENIALNGFKNIEVVPIGLSDREQLLEIHEVDDTHEGLNTFFLGERKSKGVQRVPLKTLDSQVESLSISRIDFIKIDVEGSELPALRGAKECIGRWRPRIMVEINELTYKAAGYVIADVAKFFEDLNYQATAINKRGMLESIHTLPAFGNIIFTPRELNMIDYHSE